MALGHGVIVYLSPLTQPGAACGCLEMTVWRRRDTTPLEFCARGLDATLPIPHLCTWRFALAGCSQAPVLWRFSGLLGAWFSFSFFGPKGCGASAPSQCLMGHLLLLAVCPKAPQSLHFICRWKRTSCQESAQPQPALPFYRQIEILRLSFLSF